MIKKTQKLSFRFEVDQSVRIEELNRDTIIGIGDQHAQFAYRLPRKIKRRFNEYFRRMGKAHRCAPMLFAAAIVLSLRKSKKMLPRLLLTPNTLVMKV